MARTDNTPGTDVDQQQSAEVAIISNKALLAQFAEMAVMIPREDGNGTENILAQILSATTWEQLDQPWDVSSIDDVLGKRLKLESATRRPSTYAGGLGVFLVLKLTDPKDGKQYVKTTGSVSIVGQVAAAYAMNAMPLLVEWCKSEKPTEDGFYPQHLKIHDSFGPGRAGA